jgi:CheY-like chemotaxis protein
MTREILERVLEPFFTTKPVGKGTGLGLSMVYGFVKQSGGHLKIYSEPGHGTTVNLYLPSAADIGEGGAQGAETGELPHGTGDEVVLVVEDEELVRKLTVRLLRGLAYQALEAKDGVAASAMLDGLPRLDLLLTDVVLPKGVSGPAIARLARQKRPGVKVLFMSGYPRDAITGDGTLGEGIPLISKPFSKSELARKIREMLDGK